MVSLVWTNESDPGSLPLVGQKGTVGRSSTRHHLIKQQDITHHAYRRERKRMGSGELDEAEHECREEA